MSSVPVPPPSPAPPPPPSGGGSDNFPLDFIWKTHDYTNNYIRFADTKAAVMIALATGLLAGLLKAEAHHYCAPSRLNLTEPTWSASWLGFGALVALVCLGLSVLAGILAITPRLWNTAPITWFRKLAGGGPPETPKGYIYWRAILAHGGVDPFWLALSAQSKPQLTEALAKHLYILADIADIKFGWVNRSIWAWFVGAVVGCLFILGSS